MVFIFIAEKMKNFITANTNTSYIYKMCIFELCNVYINQKVIEGNNYAEGKG